MKQIEWVRLKMKITLSTRRTCDLLDGDDSNSILGSELNAKNSRTSCEQFRTSFIMSFYKGKSFNFVWIKRIDYTWIYFSSTFFRRRIISGFILSIPRGSRR